MRLIDPARRQLNQRCVEMEPVDRTLVRALDIGLCLLAVMGALGSSIGSAAELVGRIAGDFSVGPSGAAAYRIAIEVPEAANGMKPNIALAYNSNAVDGLAGVGWNLSGFSSITRCGLSIALDSRRQGMSYMDDDRFCLDGQPLIKTSAGVYGGNNVEYRAEIHEYQKVTSHGTVGSGPEYFLVRMPNGLVRAYGSSTSSRIDAPNSGEVRVWALNRVTDKFSNEILFEYNERPDGEYDPRLIRWGGLAAYSLEFVYEGRPDKRYGYVAGSPWSRTQRLTNILYKYQDITVHDYQLAYEESLPGTGRSRLAAVTQCGILDCLPSTKFDWQDGGVGWNGQSTTVDGYKQFKAFIDYDGDGDTDVVSGEYPGQWQVQTASQGNLSAPEILSIPVMGNGDGFTIVPLEFNGDGLGDFMVIGADGHFHVYISNADEADPSCNLFCDHDTEIMPADAGVPSGAAIDINGDGLDELVYIRDQTLSFRRNLGGRFHTFEQATLIGLPPQGGHYIFWNNANFPSVDFNGDGRKDLLIRATEGQLSGGVAIYYDIYLSEYDSYYGDTFSSTVYGSTRLQNTSLVATGDILTPDINGDGLADILFKDAITLRWWTMVSDGKALGPPQETGIIPIIGKSQVVDYDGDGWDDFLAKQQNEGWRVFLSDGSSYDRGRFVSVSLPVVSHAQQSNSYIDTVDLTGDGYRDLLLLGESDGSERRVKLHDAPRADLLIGITDGLDNIYRLAYNSLSNANVYQADTTSGSPGDLSATYLVRGGPRQVIEHYDANDGIGGIYRISYQYWNAQRNRTGRGFLGFAQIRTLDSRNTRYTTSGYHQDFPYIGRLKSRKITRNPDGPREESFVWGNANDYSNVESLPFRRYYSVRLDSSDQIDYDEDSQTVIKRVIRNLSWNDDHGVVDKDEEYILTDTWNGWPNNLFYTKRQVAGFDEGIRTNEWCLGRATRVDVTKYFPDARPVQTETRTTSSLYEQSTCNLREEKSGSPTDPAQQLKITYGMDEYGRTRTITLNDGNDSLPQRKTEFIYPNGWTSHATTEISFIDDQPNHEFGSTWYEALGLAETATNVQGIATAWTYDEFGRLTRERQVTLGSETELSYQTACNGWCPDNQKYSIAGTRSDGFWSTTHYDRFGREVGEAHALIDGESRQAFIYDDLGRLVKQNVPYVAGDVEYWSHYTYDNLDRRTAERKPVNENDFTGLSETLFYYWGDYVYRQDAELRWTSYLYRPDGLIHQITDTESNVAEYRYTPFGEIASISDPDDALPTTEMTYDSLGHLVSRIDADTGVWSFDYNVFGKLNTQHDDQGHSLTINYDQLGRMTERIEDEGISSWSYVQSGNGFGLLNTVAGPTDILPSGYTRQHIYNGLAQLGRTVTAIDGVPYQTDYGYNSQGQMSSMAYPSTITAGSRPSFNFSYTNGYLHLVDKNDGVGVAMPIYEVLETDASGRETRTISGGDFLESRHTYDRGNTHLIDIKAGAFPLGVAGIQDYEYTWDKLGNLSERTDLNRNVTESFVYDGLNRLTETWLNSQRTQSLTYHPDGRIATRLGDNGYLGVGMYAYGSGDAVISIVGDRPNAYHYDGNGNMDCRGDTASSCASGDIVNWYSFNKPSAIYYGSDYSSFTYAPDRKRIKQTIKDGATVKSIQYVDRHFEREIKGNSTRYRSFVFANGRVVYMLQETRTTASCGGTTYSANGYFIHRDHQNSVDQMVLDAVSSLSITSSFDSFGKRRNPDWTADDADLQLNTNHVTNRGYTGHEHIDHVRLIHMNGRVQDPLIGQMLSADPLIGDLMNPQSLNRYSYVMNNPLAFTDPTGFACQAGSDSDTGGCRPASRGELNRVKDLAQALSSIKGAGTVLVGTDTMTALGRVANGLGLDSFMLGNLDVVAALPDSDLSSLDWVQRSEVDGSGMDIFLKRKSHRPAFTAIGKLEVGTNIFLGFVGVSGFSGFTFDGQGNTCLVTTICAQLGLGAFAGYGGAGTVGVGEPLEDGTSNTLGFFAVGGVGSVGGGSFDVNRTSLTLGKGYIGKGLGGAGGIQLCANNVSGCN